MCWGVCTMFKICCSLITIPHIRNVAHTVIANMKQKKFWRKDNLSGELPTKKGPRNATSSLLMYCTAALLMPVSHFCPLADFCARQMPNYFHNSWNDDTEMPFCTTFEPRASCLGLLFVSKSCLCSCPSAENFKSVRFFFLTFFSSSESPMYWAQHISETLPSFIYILNMKLD